MKSAKLILFCFSFLIALSLAGQAPSFEQANDLYKKGDFAGAITAYNELIAGGVKAPEIFYNLGNSYYRADSIGKAILNFEKALLLAPDDEDIKTNLRLAGQKTEDKIDVAPGNFTEQIKEQWLSLASERVWSQLFLISFSLMFAAFAMYLFRKSPSQKKLFFYSGVLLVLCTSVLFFSARSSFLDYQRTKRAVILAESASVLSAPDQESTRLFILHEGTKVTVTDQHQGWMEVKIDNGNQGWLKTSDLGLISL